MRITTLYSISVTYKRKPDYRVEFCNNIFLLQNLMGIAVNLFQELVAA